MIDFLPLYRDLKPSTRTSYRGVWRVYLAYCGQVGIDPYHCSVPQAQAWVDSMLHEGRTPAVVHKHVTAVRSHLEYCSMMGVRPMEPFTNGMVALPRVTPRTKPLYDHEQLSDERVAQALYHSRADDRAHGVLWACAGMGLSTADVRNVNATRIKRVGVTSVALVPRRGRAHLVPVPRELALVVERSGWPSGAALVSAVKPYIHTSPKDLRDFHRDCAIRLGVNSERVYQGMNGGQNPKGWQATDRTRFSFSTHPAVIVCAHLHQMLVDISGR